MRHYFLHQLVAKCSSYLIEIEWWQSFHYIYQLHCIWQFKSKFKFKFKICLLSIYRDATCIQLSTLCLIYTTAQSLWNGNGTCRPAANPGTTAPAWRHGADTKAPRPRDPTEARGGIHSMKVTIYAPPFRPPLFQVSGKFVEFRPLYLSKNEENVVFWPLYLSKNEENVVFRPLFFIKIGQNV